MKARKYSLLKKRELLRRFTAKTRDRETRVHLREFQEKDREKIQEILGDVKIFTQAEIDVAMSLVDETLGRDQSYCFVVAVDQDDTALGYICYGQAPMTANTWEVYWIAVSRRYQRRHIGSLLLEEVEKDIRVKAGRLIVIETSTKPSYRSTRKFYLEMGYRVTARIPRFYSEVDDKLILCKYITR
jgi:ribosomal protein S18 acetylase RimI-like enzyme